MLVSKRTSDVLLPREIVLPVGRLLSPHTHTPISVAIQHGGVTPLNAFARFSVLVCASLSSPHS